MTKWVWVGFALSLLFASEQVTAGEPDAEQGRYQVIPDAVLPGKGGKLEKRTLLLDSVTGLTWVITRHPSSDQGAEPLWTPIETRSASTPVAPLAPAKSPKTVEAKPAKPKASRSTNHLDRRFSTYDSNP